MLRLATACLLAISQARSEQDYDEAKYFEEEYNSAKSFEFYGDCLALSPVIFGTPGPYVTSDMQYVQQLVEDIRMYGGDDTKKGVLEDEFAMSLGSRFFVSESHDESGNEMRHMVAAELRLEKGIYFLGKIDDFNMSFNDDPMMDMAFAEERSKVKA